MGHDETFTPKAPRSLWPVFFWSAIGLALFLIANKALLSFSGPVQPEDAERAAQRIKAYKELMEENETKLNSYSWVDKEKGSVQIPIQVAISLAQERLSRQSPLVWQPPAENLPAPTNNSPPTVAPTPEQPPKELPSNELIPNMDSANGTDNPPSSVEINNPQTMSTTTEDQSNLPFPGTTEFGKNP